MKKLFGCIAFSVFLSQAHATLDFYDSFNYTTTGVQLATASAPTWVAYVGGGIHPTNNPGSLSYPNLPTAPSDNSVLFNGSGGTATGVAARNLAQLYTGAIAQTLYYSLTLNVSNISTNDWGGGANLTSGSFMLGFNQKLQNGTTIAQIDAAAPLLIRGGDPANVSGTNNDFQGYQLGVGVTATTATRIFDSNHTYNPGDTLFIVVSYTFNPGQSDDVARLYVNPIPGSLEIANTPVVTTTAGALDVTNNQIQSFFLRNNSVEPARTIIDDLRVGTSWADVTPLVPPVILSINSIANNGTTSSKIGVRFDRTVTLPSATNRLNYVVNAGTVTVENVQLRPDGRSVEVITTTPVGEFFSVCVSNVQGVASNSALTIATGYASEYLGTTIKTPGEPGEDGQVFTSFWDTFDVTASGLGFGEGADDHFHFIQQLMSGNFDVRVRVTSLNMADSASQAGLMARESLAANSAAIDTFFTPTNGLNQILATVRPLVGGSAIDFLTSPPVTAAPNDWLRMTRSNNVFTTYYATNGMNWIVSGVTTQSFATNLYVGMAVSAHSNTTNTTASFTSFLAEGGRPGDEIYPTLSASLNGANISLTWPQTPRSHAVEVSTNLTEWGLLVIPIGLHDTSWQMTIPMGMFGNELYMRPTRVAKLIPDIASIMVTTGIILSPGSGLTTNATAGTLCSPAGVISGTAFAQTGSYIIFTNASTSASSIDTVNSSSGVNSVLQVKNITSLATSCNDDSGVLTTSKVFPLPGATATPTLRKYTFITGGKSGLSPTPITTSFQVYCTP